jgi:hypothetical protein
MSILCILIFKYFLDKKELILGVVDLIYDEI